MTKCLYCGAPIVVSGAVVWDFPRRTLSWNGRQKDFSRAPVLAELLDILWQANGELRHYSDLIGPWKFKSVDPWDCLSVSIHNLRGEITEYPLTIWNIPNRGEREGGYWLER